MTDPTTPFPEAALPENRSGRLTSEQAALWQRIAAERRKGVRRMAVPIAAIGALLLFVSGPASKAAERQATGAGALALAAVILVASGRDRLTADVREGRVEAVEGAIGKSRTQSTGSGANARHYLDIAGRRLLALPLAYQAAPDGGIVRAYFLPRSGRVVNLERLPDRPLPAGPGAPAQVIKQMADAFRHHDRAAMAEARASAEALKHAFEDAITGAPPAGDRPSSPLTTEALCGSWANPLVTLTLAADGTATMSMFGGAPHNGHWLLNEHGRLFSDASGEMEPVDAELAGDRLTVTIEGRRVAFTRVPPR
ncbi:MAG TPA: hypothetical protein VL309_10855 [Vicinamibacterales bacterium]|jgi:hypothetical protein|nr:hypothetical protein [Vicinamibacterales bacterium]